MEVIAKGVTCLKIVSYGFIFYGLGMVIVQSLNGAGDTYTPTFINLCCFWLLEIPLAYMLAIHTDLAEKGVAIVMISSDLEEVMGMSDRIMVMCRGHSTTTLPAENADKEHIMALATGVAVA